MEFEHGYHVHFHENSEHIEVITFYGLIRLKKQSGIDEKNVLDQQQCPTGTKCIFMHIYDHNTLGKT